MRAERRFVSVRIIGAAGRALVLCACLLAAGCASHSSKLAVVRGKLIEGQPVAALETFAQEKEKPNDLLYLLERGYLEHAAGNYEASNIAFEAAELRAEELYTKSVTGELASLVTSDKVLPYRGTPYELVMIQYYRVFNYLALGNYDGALVEARKANQRLAELSDKKEGKSGYTDDAFMQYVTGLLFENAGESNDAAVAYRDAYRVYKSYQTNYGVQPPPDIAIDLYQALKRIGADDEAAQLADAVPDLRESVQEASDANVVLFVESGFTPFLEPVDIVLPIHKEKEDERYKDCHDCENEYAGVLVGRYGDNIYAYSGSRYQLDHVLRFSFPQLIDFPSGVSWVEVATPVNRVVPVNPAQPLEAIARKEFNRRLPQVLLKTVARALVKEFARTRAKKEDKTLGAIINIANLVTEQADTRTWLFLPQRILMTKLQLPPGPAAIEVVFHAADDSEIDRQAVEVDVRADGLAFCRVRSYK